MTGVVPDSQSGNGPTILRAKEGNTWHTAYTHRSALRGSATI